MACAIWRDKYTVNIFHSSGIFWVCSTLVNEEKDFPVFCPYLAIQLHTTPSKVAEVIHELEFAVYLVGSFFTSLKQWGLLYLPVTSGGNFSVPSVLHPSRTVTLCLILFYHGKESPL
jgi:hypothetical protein